MMKMVFFICQSLSFLYDSLAPKVNSQKISAPVFNERRIGFFGGTVQSVVINLRTVRKLGNSLQVIDLIVIVDYT